MTKQDFDFKEIQRQLANEGLVVEVHSAVAQYGLYVATYRDRENFFNYVHMSMITRDQELKKVLSSLQRHDKIRITGKFADNDSPQKHIKLSNIEVLKKYEPTPGLPKHDYPENIPEELKAKNSARFLVHAVHADGKILVLEYKEMVVPIFVTRNELSRDLYRNDKIILNYVIQENPGRPTHLELDPNVENPIEVFDRIEDQNEKMATLQGELILFPKSPQVSFDVWALLQTDEFGIKTNYTIVNFEDMDKFKAIRDKMAAAWAKDPQNFVSGRNKLVHNKIEVKARGRLNVVDPNQANPQIMLDSADDLEIIVK
ncbi:hypothetical protein GW915_04710 [bacterium]|nr:hypothetical protein [bacterium]